jgi:hypothetical protein
MNAKRYCLGACFFWWGLVVSGCEAKKEQPKPMADIASDTRTLEHAQGAANAVIAAAGDCDAVRAALPEARRALEEARAKVRTVAGTTTLGALQTRVNQVAETCPPEALPPGQ